MEHMDINQFNCWAKNHIFDDSKFDNDGFIISENTKSFKSTGILPLFFKIIGTLITTNTKIVELQLM